MMPRVRGGGGDVLLITDTVYVGLIILDLASIEVVAFTLFRAWVTVGFVILTASQGA